MVTYILKWPCHPCLAHPHMRLWCRLAVAQPCSSCLCTFCVQGGKRQARGSGPSSKQGASSGAGCGEEEEGGAEEQAPEGDAAAPRSRSGTEGADGSNGGVEGAKKARSVARKRKPKAGACEGLAAGGLRREDGSTCCAASLCSAALSLWTDSGVICGTDYVPC